MKKVLGFLIYLVLSGCATVPTMITRDPRTGTWNQIKMSGISQDADYYWTTGRVVPYGDNFISVDSEKVTWWALFGAWTFWNTAVFQSKWYDPSGKLFWEEECTNGTWNKEFAKCSLAVSNSPVRNMPGQWKVEIYYQGSLIDSKHFQIKPSSQIPIQTPLPVHPQQSPNVSAPSSDLWVPVADQRTGEQNRFFIEHYEKAKWYFEKKMYGESRGHLNVILEKEPHRTEAHLALAAIHFRELEWDKTLKELDYVIQNPVYRDRAMNVRSLVLEMKQKSEAKLQ